ncbi:SH3 domain-containing protein [Treponema maltophilum]|uniref:SH3 domain-containing protein n=1 Tax=Treponema maltophilum TaxID=51160 RepID=UPI003D91DAAC
MEKSIRGTRAKRNNRLLNFLNSAPLLAGLCAACIFPLPAQSVQNESLRFILRDSSASPNASDTSNVSNGSIPKGGVQKGEDCVFELALPGIPPSAVSVRFAALPSGAEFRGSEKRELFASGSAGAQRGTLFEYTVRFRETGAFSLLPARVSFGGKTVTVPFERVDVYENPYLLVPEFFFVADGQARAGEPLTIRLTGRFFEKVESIDWEVPERGLFEKIGEKTNLPSAAENFAADTEIAQFVYTPFFEGKEKLPAVSVKARAYDGQPYTIAVADFELTVLPKKNMSAKRARQSSAALSAVNSSEASAPAASAVSASAANAFSSEEKNNGEEPEALARHVADLRKKERTAIFVWPVRTERKHLEREAALQNPDEPSFIWTLLCAGILVVSLIVLYALFVRRRKIGGRFIFLAALCLALQMACVFVLIKNVPESARGAVITRSTPLRTIPEPDAKGTISLTAGMRLKVLRSSGAWYLVSASGGHSGWILKDECIIIE